MSSYRRRLMMANQSEENLILYGNSIQNGIPTPDNPIEILSLENPEINTDGKKVVLNGLTLRGIGNYKDRIYTKDGKVWYEQRSGYYKTSLGQKVYINKKTSIGAQLFTDNNIVDEKYKSIGVNATKTENNPGLSTHFTYDEIAYTAWGQTTDNTMMAGVRLWFLSDNFATQNEAQLWFNDNQIEVIYPLLTPIVTEITGTLAEKILAIDKSKNIIVTSANGVSGNVEVIEE